MAKCKKGTKKRGKACVPNKGCRFIKGGKGAVTCKGAKSSSKSRGKASASCKKGMKKGKGGRCVLKKGYKFSGGRVVKAKAA